MEEIVNISSISNEHLQDEIIGSRIISTYRKLQTEKRLTDVFYLLLMGYAGPQFRDFESCLRIGLDEGDIWFILKQ